MISVNQSRLAAAVQAFGLRIVVLFGSHAKQRPPPGPDSDVDVAIHDGCPRQKFWDCYKAISKATGEAELDLVRLEQADPLFRHEIMQSGVLLDGRSPVGGPLRGATAAIARTADQQKILRSRYVAGKRLATEPHGTTRKYTEKERTRSVSFRVFPWQKILLKASKPDPVVPWQNNEENKTMA